MAKFCTNCGNELEENAIMCSKCGKMVNNNTSNGNTKKKGLPAWAIVLIVFGGIIFISIIGFIMLFIIGFNYVKDNGINIRDYIEEVISTSGTIGDTLVSDDVRITLTNTLIYSSVEGDGYTDTPGEGKEYLVFFFNIENIGDDSEYISNYNFSGYVDDNFINDVILFNDVDGSKILGKDLTPGEKTYGYVAYEVDTNWKKFEIKYKNNSFDLDDSITFVVVNQDNGNNNA